MPACYHPHTHSCVFTAHITTYVPKTLVAPRVLNSTALILELIQALSSWDRLKLFSTHLSPFSDWLRTFGTQLTARIDNVTPAPLSSRMNLLKKAETFILSSSETHNKIIPRTRLSESFPGGLHSITLSL